MLSLILEAHDRLAYNEEIMEKERATVVEKTFSRVSLLERKSDFAYWQSQPYEARLAALERIRQEYHRWKYGAEPRLQKVYSVAQR